MRAADRRDQLDDLRGSARLVFGRMPRNAPASRVAPRENRKEKTGPGRDRFPAGRQNLPELQHPARRQTGGVRLLRRHLPKAIPQEEPSKVLTTAKTPDLSRNGPWKQRTYFRLKTGYGESRRDFAIAEWPLETKGLVFRVQLDTFGVGIRQKRVNFMQRIFADPKPRARIRAAIEREQGSDPGQINAARRAGIN